MASGGEICVTRHPFDDVVRGSAPALPTLDPSFPERERRHAVLLDRFLDALRGDGREAIGALLSAGHTFATRLDALGAEPAVHSGGDRDAARKALAEIFGPARDIALVTRFATDWYVFAEYVGWLESGAIRRFAAIHPVEDGVLTGTFGYGRDEVSAG